MPAAVATAPTATTASADSFQRYYEEAGPDYAAWSPAFNMHFGFFRRGINPLDREAMLEQMNAEVLSRLQLRATPSPRILDMGSASAPRCAASLAVFPPPICMESPWS